MSPRPHSPRKGITWSRCEFESLNCRNHPTMTFYWYYQFFINIIFISNQHTSRTRVRRTRKLVEIVYQRWEWMANIREAEAWRHIMWWKCSSGFGWNSFGLKEVHWDNFNQQMKGQENWWKIIKFGLVSSDEKSRESVPLGTQCISTCFQKKSALVIFTTCHRKQ